MPKETISDIAAPTLALLAALSAVIDALVTHDPALEAAIAGRLRAKLAELQASPEHAPAAPTLQMVLAALERSARAAQRRPPQGRA